MRARMFWLAAAVGCALIWWESSHAGADLPLVEWWGHYDKLVHASAWAVLAGLVAAGGVARGWRARAAAVAIAFGLVYGIVDEWHQSYVPGRDSDPADVVADVCGSIAGAALVLAAERRRARGMYKDGHGDRA